MLVGLCIAVLVVMEARVGQTRLMHQMLHCQRLFKYGLQGLSIDSRGWQIDFCGLAAGLRE